MNGAMATAAVSVRLTSRRRMPGWLYVVVLLADGLIVGLPLGALGWTAGALQLAARYTARLSFLWFLMVFITRPLAILSPRPATRWMLRRRRHLGLTFALAHAIHLAALLAFIVVSGRPANRVTVIVGGLGYVVLALMAATSNDTSARLLGANWKRLHTFGLYYLLFVFVATYLSRFASPRPPEPLPIYVALLTLAACAVGLRIAAGRSIRTQSASIVRSRTALAGGRPES
jgi:methionine sulfoxide reductase heme-binding subunit